MQVIIVGCGKVGQEIVGHISSEGHNVTVIDTNSQVIERIVDKYDVFGISGNGASYEILEKANCKNSDLFIAVTSSDEVNILACVVAKRIGVKSTIARIRNYGYSKEEVKLKDDFGIDMIINPERECANDIVNILNFPEAINVDPFAGGKIDLFEIYLQENNSIVGLTPADLRTNLNLDVLVCAVQRGENIFIPTGQFVFKAKDRIHLASDRENAKLFLNKTGLDEEKIKNVIIIGCGMISVYLADYLIKNNCNVKIIEKDINVCEEYSKVLPQADIIYGDGSDQSLLEEEGINNTDAIVCLTGMDEENIIISMYAGKKNVHKIIAKVDRSSFGDLVETISGSSIVSPKEITSSRIVSYVRASSNAYGSNIQTLYKLVNNKVEAIEFIAKESSRTLNVMLKDLKIKKNILIASIVRNSKVIIPGGMDEIKADDSVIVITLNSQRLDDLDDILE